MSLSMFCTKFNKKCLINLNARFFVVSRRCQSTEAAEINSTSENVSDAEPVYPPILDLTRKKIAERKKIAWHEEVKNVKTIEGKLIKVNMPKYYGYQMLKLTDDKFRYNCLPYIQHWTRTQYEDGIPSGWCKRSTEEIDGLVNSVKELVEDAILFQYQECRHEYERSNDFTPVEKNRLKSLRVCTEINRILLNALSPTIPHLKEIEVDFEPRHEAFWFVGGIEPVRMVQKIRKGIKTNTEEDIKEPVDRPFQYIGKPLLALRNRLPLEPVIDNFYDAAFNVETVPKFPCDPRTVGYSHGYQHGITIPGFWPGSEHHFGQLSYHDRRHFVIRNRNYGVEDYHNALHAQGILASYSWLLGQACYQGFSTYNDLTYPLTTQTIITDGQLWSFYVYQLNTTTLHNVVFDKNPKVNKCWGTKELKLFEEIDANGKLIELNTDVIRQLIEFYGSVPQQRNYEIRPYLDKEEPTVADIADPERRQFLESRFKHLVSLRPRHRLLPEIYLWEKIYKIDYNTRPMDARRRFFELNINPWARRLDDHQPAYIPKACRPGGPKSKKKWENTYWP